MMTGTILRLRLALAGRFRGFGKTRRSFARDMTLSVSYVGTKSTKLWNGTPLNAVEIFNNGFLKAFDTTRAGGDAALFDQMLSGLNLGSGRINGTTVTGSASLRANTNTR